MTTQSTPEPVATATGYSDSYSFAEALQDALRHLPPPCCPYPDQLLVTRVVELGSEQGGLVGFDRLYVRIERLPDPVGMGAMGGDVPFPWAKGLVPPLELTGVDAPFPLSRVRSRANTAVPVFSVDTVSVDVAESNPPQYAIRASGMANTSGWGRAWLRPVLYKPPADGVYSFEFVAIPPTGMVLQVLTPISTPTQLWRPGDGSKVEAIRVIAATNEKTAKVDPASPVKMVEFGGVDTDG